MREYTIVPVPWQPLLKQLVEDLGERGLTVRRTFDLQAARKSLGNADGVPCPHHGTSRCTCQYLVLRVSRRGQSVSAIVVHGHDRVTKISVGTASKVGAQGSPGAQVREELAAMLAPDRRSRNLGTMAGDRRVRTHPPGDAPRNRRSATK